MKYFEAVSLPAFAEGLCVYILACLQYVARQFTPMPYHTLPAYTGPQGHPEVTN